MKIKKENDLKILESIDLFSEQLKQAFFEMNKLRLPADYKKIDEIVVCGMGGSSLGTDIIKSLYFKNLKKPIYIINGYNLPNWVSKNTLIIGSSYSGNTEETVSCVKEAFKKKLKLFVITTGGLLEQFAFANSIPFYVFDPVNNPSAQPRMGLGYSIMSQLVLFKKIGVLNITDSLIKKTINNVSKSANNKKPIASKNAEKIKGSVPIIVASEFLSGNAHTLANQINENAKTFSNFFILPELSHHLLEGLIKPKNINKNLLFFFLESDSYSNIIKQRIKITKRVLAQNKIKALSYKAKQKDKLAQSLEMIIFGSYLSLYLAITNNVDPLKIPVVDYFKKQLKKKG